MACFAAKSADKGLFVIILAILITFSWSYSVENTSLTSPSS